MARARNTPTVAPDEAVEPDEIFDEQAEVGSLFALQGPGFEDVSWSIHRYKTRAEMASDPAGQRREWVADIAGALNGAELVEIIGGGTFQFQGYVPRDDARGVRLKYNERIALAGPRKNFAVQPVQAAIATAAPAASIVPDPTTRLIRMMMRQAAESEARLTKVLEALAQRQPESKPTGLVELVTALKTMHDMTGGGNHATNDNPLEMAKMMLDKFHEGVTIGQAREPIQVDGDGDPPNYMPILEKGLEIIQTMMSRPRPVRPGGPPPAGTPGASSPPPQHPPQHTTAPSAAQEPSSAVVVEEDAVPQGQPEVTSPEFRWTTAVDALYRAMIAGRDSNDFAASLEDILNAQELEQCRNASAAEFYTYLGPIIAGYPALKEPQGRAYVDRVLADLRAGEDDDAEEDVKP